MIALHNGETEFWLAHKLLCLKSFFNHARASSAARCCKNVFLFVLRAEMINSTRIVETVPIYDSF